MSAPPARARTGWRALPRDRREWCVRRVEFEANGSRIRGHDTVRRVDGAADREPESGVRGVHPAYPPVEVAVDLCLTLPDGLTTSVLIEPAAWPAARQLRAIEGLLDLLGLPRDGAVDDQGGDVQQDVVQQERR